MSEILITIDDAAKMLKISRQSLYRWAKEGKLQMLKIGNHSTRIKQSDIERLINDALPIYAHEEQSSSMDNQVPLGHVMIAAQEIGMSKESIEELSRKISEIQSR